MSMTKQDSSIKSKIDERLQRIANVLLLNASFTDNLGLLNGKMGIGIFFYHYSRYTGNKIFEDYAGEIIDEIYEEINPGTPVNFEDGLTGIGWGIEYLVKNKFVQADTDEALVEIDNSIYRTRLHSQLLIKNGNDIFGYGLYYIMRLINHKIDDTDLDTLIKKYHLIFLADECERILLQKLYQKFSIESLSIDSINSFIWFLLEMDRLKVFPVKISKVLNCIPKYLIDILQNADKDAGKLLLVSLTEKAAKVVSDQGINKLLKKTLKKYDGILKPDFPEETVIPNFIKNSWQQLIYQRYFKTVNEMSLQISKTFSFIEDENNWNNRLDNLTKDNIGLTGLTG
ncbi:MAG: hypothetical protein EPN88_08505, partial [Bacteroidetes bacterium]